MTKPQTDGVASPPQSSNRLGKLLFAVLTILCFAYLYYRLNGAAGRAGLGLAEYMQQVFAAVNWVSWVGLMVAYSTFYFLIDTLVVSRVLNWFVVPVRYRDVLPIRGSAYIISVFNEQVGKGAMAWYLNRRDRVPGWEVASAMLFIMVCEMFYLLAWASIGYGLAAEQLPAAFALIPYIALAGLAVLLLWWAYCGGYVLPQSKLRQQPIMHAFRQARPWHYGAFFLLRSPALLVAVLVYSIALQLFGVPASFIELLPYLPVIFFAAAVPTPMRAAAITFWVVLFPDNEGAMAAFGFVQHNFFILFNALIGLLFWRRAQRELFGN